MREISAEDKNPLIIDATNSMLSTYDSIFVIRKKKTNLWYIINDKCMLFNNIKLLLTGWNLQFTNINKFSPSFLFLYNGIFAQRKSINIV